MKRPLLLASLVVLIASAFGAEAHAQTSVCNPPCQVGDQCIEGRCYTTAEPKAVPPPEPAPPPAVVPQPAPAVEPAPPPPPPPAPPRHRLRRHPAELEDTATDDDDNGLPPRRRGLLAIPFIGIHSVQGLASDDFDLGGRGGAIVGVHVDPNISLNVEAAVDIMSPQGGASQVSAHDLTLAFSPLFHIAGNTGELVLGPMLGFWSDNFTATGPDRSVTRASQWGWAFGLNVGAFAAVNQYAELGLLISYQFIDPSAACTHGPGAATRSCQTSLFPPEILGVTAAALF